MVNLTTYMIATTAMIMGISALDHASVEQVREALKASHIIPAVASASASDYAPAAVASMIVEANAKGKFILFFYFFLSVIHSIL